MQFKMPKLKFGDAESIKARRAANAEAKQQQLDDIVDAMDRAFNSGKANRAKITESAQQAGLEAVRMAGVAMECDDEAAEAARLAIITEGSGDRAKIRNARRRARDARIAAKKAHHQATTTAKESYDAIKFSEPGKLGYLRLVQVFYALNIVGLLVVLQMTSRDAIVYNSVTILDWIDVILSGVAFWLFANYLKVTRPFMIAVSAFNLVAPTIVSIINGTFSWPTFIIRAGWYIFLIIYFWRSKRVKAVMVNDFASLRLKTADDKIRVRRSGWPFVRNLIMYFIVFSVLGHWMEAGMCQFIRLGLVQGEYDPSNTMLWRDWLYPYPMHGMAVIIISLVLYPMWQWLIKKFDPPIVGYAISFLANALTCSCIEFFTGLVVNADLQLWDYTDNFGNIMGQVCLQNALAFGVAASIIAWVVYPALERALARVPEDVMNIAFVVVAVFGGILWSLYIIDPPQNHTVQQITEAVTTTNEPAADDFEWAITGAEVDVDSLQESLDGMKEISDDKRAELQKHIDAMKKDVEAINQIYYDKGETSGADTTDAKTEATDADADTKTEATDADADAKTEATDAEGADAADAADEDAGVEEKAAA